MARRLGVDDGLIIANNPHLTDPAVIFPTDRLCLPVPIFFPCTALLHPIQDMPSALGVILVRELPLGRQGTTVVLVGLPPPETLGDFDAYVAEIEFAGIGI